MKQRLLTCILLFAGIATASVVDTYKRDAAPCPCRLLIRLRKQG